uniref:Uncharacterized protein n=1 Tax=Setaria italica TaxID=4555 RepID=K3YFJ4_SETIT
MLRNYGSLQSVQMLKACFLVLSWFCFGNEFHCSVKIRSHLHVRNFQFYDS